VENTNIVKFGLVGKNVQLCGTFPTLDRSFVTIQMDLGFRPFSGICSISAESGGSICIRAADQRWYLCKNYKKLPSLGEQRRLSPLAPVNTAISRSLF